MHACKIARGTRRPSGWCPTPTSAGSAATASSSVRRGIMPLSRCRPPPFIRKKRKCRHHSSIPPIHRMPLVVVVVQGARAKCRRTWPSTPRPSPRPRTTRATRATVRRRPACLPLSVGAHTSPSPPPPPSLVPDATRHTPPSTHPSRGGGGVAEADGGDAAVAAPGPDRARHAALLPLLRHGPLRPRRLPPRILRRQPGRSVCPSGWLVGWLGGWVGGCAPPVVLAPCPFSTPLHNDNPNRTPSPRRW